MPDPKRQQPAAPPAGGVEPANTYYSNFAGIGHSHIEFWIDFRRMGPEQRDGEHAATLARVIMHPMIAKAFRDALAENIRRYEERFGTIPMPQQPTTMH
jgi:hypothetical protein